MPTEFIVYGVVFLSIFFLFEGVYLVLFGRNVRGNSKVNRRLQMMDGGLSKKDTLDKLRKGGYARTGQGYSRLLNSGCKTTACGHCLSSSPNDDDHRGGICPILYRIGDVYGFICNVPIDRFLPLPALVAYISGYRKRPRRALI